MTILEFIRAHSLNNDINVQIYRTNVKMSEIKI